MAVDGDVKSDEAANVNYPDSILFVLAQLKSLPKLFGRVADWPFFFCNVARITTFPVQKDRVRIRGCATGSWREVPVLVLFSRMMIPVGQGDCELLFVPEIVRAI